MSFKNLDQAGKLFGKTVLLRTDFNVPLKGKIVQDNFKIKKGLVTIKDLMEKGAKVVVISHLGRPKGMDKKLSLRPVAAELSKFLQKSIPVLDVRSLEKTKIKIDKLLPGSVVMLENIRFAKGEVENSDAFAKELADLGDAFVLDGFAVAHREAPSVSGVAKYLFAYAGFLLEEEIEGLNQIIKKPKKPLVAILGGIKMETKIPVLKNLLKKADYILVGGGIVNTYLWARGHKVGSSVVDKNFKKEILRYCSNKKVILPVDVIVGPKNGKKAKAVSVKNLNVKKELGIFDIGPQSIKLFARYIKKAKTLVWNGAMGNFEQHPYQYGTHSMARLVASRSKGKAFGVAGGGETIEVMKKLHVLNDLDLASTGGGSMLEYLSGRSLPGIEALKN
ncbi:MAG: phosphoglycerate kinase [Candidatus Magasanikbacteria bacterium]|nr:phosphoglycerate kinase [Candidatus Magasanikbacteria bacterium]